MSYKAIIAKLEDVRKHPNADRLMLATIVGCQVVVGLDARDGDVGIYFASGGQLSKEYCAKNDLIRRKDADGKLCGGMFCDKRRVRIQKLRGELSDGYFASLDSIDGLYEAIGYEFTEWQGMPVCNKYIVASPNPRAGMEGKKKIKKNVVEGFDEHWDTGHLVRSFSRIMVGDKLNLSLKMHGTSSRMSYLPVQISRKWFTRIIRKMLFLSNTKTENKYLLGTRRVILGEFKYLNDQNFRVRSSAPFIKKLHLGEVVYGEIVGWESPSKTIMAGVGKNNLKEYKKYLNYVDKMVYSYGTKQGECEFFCYRIVRDGRELTPCEVEARCLELGMKHVPTFFEYEYDGDEDRLLSLCKKFGDGDDFIDPSHVAEGVVVRVDGATSFALKYKNDTFKLLEGMLQDAGVIDEEDLA